MLRWGPLTLKEPDGLSQLKAAILTESAYIYLAEFSGTLLADAVRFSSS